MRKPPCHSKTSLTQQVGGIFFFTFFFQLSVELEWNSLCLQGLKKRLIAFFNPDATSRLFLSLKTQDFSKIFCAHGEGKEEVASASAQKQVVEVVSTVTGLTLIPPALLFTLEVLWLLHGERAPIIHSGDEKGRAD